MAAAKRTTFVAKHWGKDDRVVTVEYREIPHTHGGNDWSKNPNGNPWRAYEVLVDGKVVGQVEQVTKSTDRTIRGTRLRHPGKGRLAWAWSRPRRKGDPKGFGSINNSPGLYADNRDSAAAEILGYGYAEGLMDRR